MGIKVTRRGESETVQLDELRPGNTFALPYDGDLFIVVGGEAIRALLKPGVVPVADIVSGSVLLYNATAKVIPVDIEGTWAPKGAAK